MISERDGQGDIAVAPLVYVVDDDRDFLDEMVFGLSRCGLNVHAFSDAAALYRAYAVSPADIIVLDIGLEGEDGLSIASHLRASQSVGIVMATGRGSMKDRIVGLEKGADAYLVKPIDVRELAATVVALKNRVKRHSSSSPLPTPQWSLVEGGWVLTDGMHHRLRLTTSERYILQCLFKERGQTVERHTLVEALGEDVYDFNYSHLNTIVSRLRKRAQKSGMALPLHAIRGTGFAFTG